MTAKCEPTPFSLGHVEMTEQLPGFWPVLQQCCFLGGAVICHEAFGCLNQNKITNGLCNGTAGIELLLWHIFADTISFACLV